MLVTDDKSWSLSILSKPDVVAVLLIKFRLLVNLDIECCYFFYVSCCSLLSHFLRQQQESDSAVFFRDVMCFTQWDAYAVSVNKQANKCSWRTWEWLCHWGKYSVSYSHCFSKAVTKQSFKVPLLLSSLSDYIDWICCICRLYYRVWHLLEGQKTFWRLYFWWSIGIQCLEKKANHLLLWDQGGNCWSPSFGKKYHLMSSHQYCWCSACCASPPTAMGIIWQSF